MKIGIEIDWERRHFDMPRERVQLADRLGYDMVFTAEAHGSDGISPLGYVLGCTDRIGVGTRIIQNLSRPAALLAMTFETMRYMAPGREVICGLGSGNPTVVQGYYGHEWTPAYWRMRDYVAIMRQAFANQPLAHEGRAISIPWHEADKPAEIPPIAPLMEAQGGIPIIFGGATELMMSLAAEIGDGLLPNGGWWPGAMATYRPIIEKGLAKRKIPGSSVEDFPIWAHVDVIVTDDLRGGFATFKEYVARYTSYGPSGGHATLMEQRGYGHCIERIAELYNAGHHAEACAAVPDEYIDEHWLVGPLPRIIERWRSKWIDNGCNLIVRTDNWPGAVPAGNEVYEPLYRALRD